MSLYGIALIAFAVVSFFSNIIASHKFYSWALILLAATLNIGYAYSFHSLAHSFAASCLVGALVGTGWHYAKKR